jgi:hypothetical protein
MFPKKPKKPGMDVAIMVAPHGKPGLGSPMPVEKAKDAPADEEESADTGTTADDEAAESPQEEGGEEYGAKLLADIDAVGKRYGADSETSRALAGDMFEAIARCLKGGGESEQEQPVDDSGQGGY